MAGAPLPHAGSHILNDVRRNGTMGEKESHMDNCEIWMCSGARGREGFMGEIRKARMVVGECV